MAATAPPTRVPVADAEDDKAYEMDDLLNSEAPTEKKEDPKKAEYRMRLEAMLSGSTISGISQAFSDRKGASKVFWIVLFVFGVIGFAINFYNIIEHFAKRPILTQFDQSARPFQWPHFTFCNPLNPIPFWLSDDLIKKWTEVYEKAGTYELPPYGPAKRKDWQRLVAMASLNPAEFYRHGVEGMIWQVRVVFKSNHVATSSTAIDQYFTVHNLSAIFQSRLDSFRSPFPCYTLMPEKIPEAMKLSDNLFGEILAIKVYVIMDYRSYRIYNSSLESRKLYFYVTNPNDTLQVVFPHLIRVGSDSFFSIKQRAHDRIKNCIDEQYPIKLYNAQLTATREYHGLFDDCRNYLSQRLYYYKCKCWNPHLPIYDTEVTGKYPRICTNMSLYTREEMAENIRCLDAARLNNRTFKSFEDKLNFMCKKFDQHQCKSNIYIVSRNSNTGSDVMSEARLSMMIARSRWLPNANQNGTARYPADNITEKFYFHNYIIVNLNKAKDSTEFTFEEYEYPLSQFMSDFGGAIGLWIGLSVISFFEVMELLLVFIKYLRK